MEIWVGFVTIIGILILVLVIIKLIPTTSKVQVNETPESTSQGVQLTFSALFNTPTNNKIHPVILNREFIEPLPVTNNRSNHNSLVSELNEVIIIEPKEFPPPYINQEHIIQKQINNSERVYDFSEDFKLRSAMKLITC